MHKLLIRQLKKNFGIKIKSGDKIPDELSSFIKSVNDVYCQYDLDLSTLERSLDVSSRELNERNKKISESFEELKILKEKSEAANNAKTTFLANMSHELRTPLNAIIGLSEIIKEDMEEDDFIVDEDSINSIIRINKSGKHLLNLISDILDMSNIESGKMKLIIKRFSLEDCIKEVVSVFDEIANKNNNKIIINTDETIGFVNNDSNKVKQILNNLINNSCKFTKNGKIIVKTSICKKDSNFIIISVEDTGVGISEKKIKDLFNTFTQANDTINKEYSGTGIGLSITKKIVNLMGGNVYVKSIENEGSVFLISIPRDVKV